jgi:hypothetical protein
MVIRRVVGWPYIFGGQEHSGWLPPGAAKPLDEPVRHVLLDLEIEGDESAGFLVVATAQDGSLCWDNWYSSLTDAQIAAEADYGVTIDDWQLP